MEGIMQPLVETTAFESFNQDFWRLTFIVIAIVVTEFTMLAMWLLYELVKIILLNGDY